MTVKEAKETLKLAESEIEWNYPADYTAAFDMALEALDKLAAGNLAIGFIRDYKEHSSRTVKEAENTIDYIEAVLRGWKGEKQE